MGILCDVGEAETKQTTNPVDEKRREQREGEGGREDVKGEEEQRRERERHRRRI